MAESGVASPHPPRPAADGACGAWTACPPRPAEVGASRAGTLRDARPSSRAGLTPQSPPAEAGKDATRALRRASGKRSVTLERARQVRGRRDGVRTGRRFGDDLSTGNSKSVGSPDYDADFATLVCHMWIALEIAYHLVMKKM